MPRNGLLPPPFIIADFHVIFTIMPQSYQVIVHTNVVEQKNSHPFKNFELDFVS